MLSQEVHNNIMPMLPSEETLLIIANVVRKAQLQSQPGINPSSGSEQSQVVGHCRAMGEACCWEQCWVKLQCIKVISLAGITCDSEKEMLILKMYLKKYFKK